MAKPKDITGLVFGMLTAVKRVEYGKNGSKWLCSCSCGGEKVVSLDNLRSGSTQSCGCRYKEMGKRIALDLSGERFGRLVAVSVIHRKPWFPEWVCKCDCGKETIKRSVDLRSGNVKSCGCLKADNAKRIAKERVKSVVGMRSGRLVAIADAEPSQRKDGRVAYRSLCRCDCGKEKVVWNHRLSSGAVVSCGCAFNDGANLLPKRIRESNKNAQRKRRAVKAGSAGRFTEEQVRELFGKQRGKCAWCNADLGESFHRDHKTPLALGGSNDISNIELLCGPCNLSKSAKDPIRWANENGKLC